MAGADGLLAVGGAQAIAALAYGVGPIPPCDAVVGPGNKFVTAAKSLVAGRVAIDMLAGPSECLVSFFVPSFRFVLSPFLSLSFVSFRFVSFLFVYCCLSFVRQRVSFSILQ